MNHTVMTLTEAQRNYLRAAIACLLAVQGQAARRFVPTDFEAGQDWICASLRDDVLPIACAGDIAPLDHQDGAELADLLAAGKLELHAPVAAAGITPYFADEPGSYTDQVGIDEEAWKVPVVLTVVGAETALEAGAAASEFLARATADEAVNHDETVLAYDVGYEAAMLPAEVLRDLALGDSYMG